MRLILAAALALLASAASAQDAPPAPAAPVTVSPAEGNWGCIALVDSTKAGLLTVFAGSYGYASATFGSGASGTGNAEMGSDGVKFLDGNLTTVGIGYGLVTTDQNGADVLTLYNPDKAVLSCTPR
jgi:opacity protein-like surface antigen